MRLFELNDVVAKLAAGVAAPCPAHEGLLRTVTLAWYLRQSDQTYALALTQGARSQLAGINPDTDLYRQVNARLSLIEAECHWLSSQFGPATDSAQNAMAAFSTLRDNCGMADAHAILAAIHASTGDLPRRDTALAQAVALALEAQDQERVAFQEANQARFAALRDVRQCDAVWGPRFPQDLSGYHPTVRTAIYAYLGTRDYNSGQFGRAIDRLDQAFQGACDTGQVLTAVVIAVNAGNTYMTLNDHDATLGPVADPVADFRGKRSPAALGDGLANVFRLARRHVPLPRLSGGRPPERPPFQLRYHRVSEQGLPI